MAIETAARRPKVKIAAAAASAALLAAALLPSPATAGGGAPLKGRGKGLKLVANIHYSGGTDMEFASIKGREYGFVASAPGVGTGKDPRGIRVIDVTKPEKPVVKAFLPCALYQADVQISHDKKTLIVAADRTTGADGCKLFGKQGFMTVDISNPLKPKPMGEIELPGGSHNTTAHPTKPIVYNSSSDLVGPGTIEIVSIKNPAKPKLVNRIYVGLDDPHDISFNKKGTLAVTAAQSHFDLLDTSDPVNPKILYTGQCPGCQITHDAKFTPDGKHILIGDEAAGGLDYPCPGGALYAYMLQGNVPVLTGIYEPAEVVKTGEGTGRVGIGACTPHVFDISDDGKRLAISWYTAGTRLLDISNPHGITFGPHGAGMTEIGWFIPKGTDSWSSKFHKGPYVYSNDINRGFDVYKITAKR